MIGDLKENQKEELRRRMRHSREEVISERSSVIWKKSRKEENALPR